ncbi:MAG: MBL fold metallo-hydrolase [Actinomycetota bacterium]|nr:MBL fold metallo-hydrolase [Actinomycetota bacterium]
MAEHTKLPEGAQHLVGDTHYVPGLTNSGFISGLLIDTGAEELVYEDVAIDRLAITHGHADHFACAAAVREAGARVAAARDDASLVENPDINIRGMFSWAKPGDLLVTKLFRGEPCRVDEYIEDWSDPRATAIPLPGHTLGHTGFLTADGVMFTGDALYLQELWERHPLPYAIDPDMVVSSLERIRALDFEWLVPAHGRPVSRDESFGHIDHHIGQIRAIESLILALLTQPRSTEEIIALISADRCLSDNPAQYWLAVTTVKGFLGGLLSRGEIEFYVRAHSGWWHAL